MEELLRLISLGSLIPAIALAIKGFLLSRAMKSVSNEIIIKDENGKQIRFLTKPNTTPSEIKEFFESEISFEAIVEKQLNMFISSQKKNNIMISNGKCVDFILTHGDKVVGIEAKSDTKRFKAKWINDYFKENDGINELIMIINSEIPSEIIREVKSIEKPKTVRLISSPNGKNLSSLISNVLINDLGLKAVKTSKKIDKI